MGASESSVHCGGGRIVATSYVIETIADRWMARDKKARRFSHGVGGRTRSPGNLDRRERPLISSRCARSGQLSIFGQARSAQCKQREAMAESNRASLVNITTEKRKIVPFCVLEPPLSKRAFSLKIPKTRDLPLLANKVLQRQWGRRA